MSAQRRIVLVRHAQTTWSAAHRHTGRSDIPLTEDGRDSARVLGGRLSRYSPQTVYTSPLSRARETCALAGLGPISQPREELLEWDYGKYEGRTTADIRRERPNWTLWRDGCPGGESPQQVARRVDALLDELADPAGGDVALFAHGHLLRVLAARWIELEPAIGGRLTLDTASISVLGFEHSTRSILTWNTLR